MKTSNKNLSQSSTRSSWVAFAIALLLGQTGFSQTPKAASTPASGSASTSEDRGSDRIDLKKIEQKYWAAKDTDFTVVQNRTYTKANRFFLSMGWGPLVNDPYSFGRISNLSAGYYFSERWGTEVAFERGTLTDNSSVVAFKEQNGILPNYNTFNSYLGANLIWVPFYAKMSFLDRSIMYFDMQFAVGMGAINYSSVIDPSQIGNKASNAMAYTLDVTQQLFFHEHWAFRLDIKNKWSRQDLYRYRVPGNQDESTRNLGKINQQDTSIVFGLTFFY